MVCQCHGKQFRWKTFFTNLQRILVLSEQNTYIYLKGEMREGGLFFFLMCKDYKYE